MNFILTLLINVVRIYKFAIIARILLSWVEPHPRSGPAVMLHQATEPVLRIFRGLIPPIGMIDLSPLIAYFVMNFVEAGLMSLMGQF